LRRRIERWDLSIQKTWGKIETKLSQVIKENVQKKRKRGEKEKKTVGTKENLDTERRGSKQRYRCRQP